jgi:hypothetical protein
MSYLQRRSFWFSIATVKASVSPDGNAEEAVAEEFLTSQQNDVSSWPVHGLLQIVPLQIRTCQKSSIQRRLCFTTALNVRQKLRQDANSSSVQRSSDLRLLDAT